MGGAVDADVDPRIHSTKEHVAMAATLLSVSGAADLLGAPDRMVGFCEKIAAMYEAIPYHNFKHAFNVMHTTYLLLESYKTENSPFSKLQTAGLLLAALCHDVRHDGRTSGFHKSINSQVAQQYSKHRGSVLEAMHASVAIETMEEEGLFAKLDAPKQKELKEFIHELILATDMALHPQIIKDYSEKKDALTQAKMILHCADISNPTKQPHISKWWSHSVLKEFTDQVDEETKRGLPVSTYMKAEMFSLEEAKMHLDFIDTFVVPAWRLLANSNHFDKYVTVVCMKNIADSRQLWLDTMNQPKKEQLVAVELKRKRFHDDVPCGEVEFAPKRRYLKVNRLSRLESPADCHVT